MTFNAASLSYTFSGTGKITGAAGIVKSGAGTVTVSTDQQFYTGGVTINGGILSIPSDNGDNAWAPMRAG